MPRYIENLNECTDPTSGDYLWVVDASASASDKDRKVDVGKFPRLAVANTFTASQTIDAPSGQLNVAATASGVPSVVVAGGDGGSGSGPFVSVGRNANASTPSAGYLRLTTRVPQFQHIWPDATGVLRISTSAPTNATDTGGTVVGAQTSSLDSKVLVGECAPLAEVFDHIRVGAEAVRRFTYKSGAFNGEEFEGVVVDFAPRYGMDRDEEHPAGKSLNEITVIGDLLRAVAWLAERVGG